MKDRTSCVLLLSVNTNTEVPAGFLCPFTCLMVYLSLCQSKSACLCLTTTVSQSVSFSHVDLLPASDQPVTHKHFTVKSSTEFVVACLCECFHKA